MRIFKVFCLLMLVGVLSVNGQLTTSFNNSNYIRTAAPTDPNQAEGIWLGQGFIERNSSDIRPAFIPDNKPSWAIAIAVAWNMERNLIGKVAYPQIGSYLATVVQETELRCATGLHWDNPSHGPVFYDSSTVTGAQLNGGCFQIEGPGSGYGVLNQAYPGRFNSSMHNELCQSADNFESSAILKAYYDFYHVTTYDKYMKWNIFGTIDCTTDPLLYVKTTASGYNGGIYAFTSASSFYNSPGMVNNCYGGFPSTTANYANDVAKFTAPLEKMTTYCEYPTGSSFESYYNKDILWQDVVDYMNIVDTIYPELNWSGSIVPSVQSVFDKMAIDGKVAFTELGPVVDAIIKSLPKEYPAMIQDNPFGVLLVDDVPAGNIALIFGHDTITVGETVKLKMNLTSAKDAYVTYKWYNLQDTTTVIGTSSTLNFKPKAKGSYQIGAKICVDNTCSFIGCDPSKSCQDSRDYCGQKITVLDSASCSFTITQQTTTDANCEGDNSGNIKINLSSPVMAKVTVNSWTIEGESNSQYINSLPSAIINISGKSGLYNITVSDVANLTCEVKSSESISYHDPGNDYLTSKYVGSAGCEDTVEARIVSANDYCKLRVRAWTPIYFSWEKWVLIGMETSDGQGYFGRDNKLFPRPELDQWVDVPAIEQWIDIKKGDTIFFTSAVIGTPGASQLRDYYIEVTNAQGNVLHSVTVPAGSTGPGEKKSAGYYVSTCSPVVGNYTFEWSNSITPISTLGNYSSGHHTNTNLPVTAQVTAVPVVGNCVLQNKVEISADGGCVVTSIAEISSDLLLYPNPVRSSVSMNNNFYGTVKVLSIDGSTVLQQAKNNSELTLDLSGVKAGSYYVILVSEQETYRSKIIKL